MSPPPIRRRLQVNTNLSVVWRVQLVSTNTAHAYCSECLYESKYLKIETFASYIVVKYFVSLRHMCWKVVSKIKNPKFHLLFLQATTRWRPSSPGTTRPSGGPSSGRYEHENKWHQSDTSTKTSITVTRPPLWHNVRLPAGVRHPHGPAACDGGHRRPLLILVTALVFLSLIRISTVF